MTIAQVNDQTLYTTWIEGTGRLEVSVVTLCR
jgi:hypothetical protein